MKGSGRYKGAFSPYLLLVFFVMRKLLFQEGKEGVDIFLLGSSA